MKEITLTRGKVALVDDSDYEWLSRWKWYAFYKRSKWYAVRNATDDEQRNSDKIASIRMHREIMGATNGTLIDHRDGNGLNNQRYNLRIATNAQNLRNRGATRSNSSGYKGVSFDKQRRKWSSQITKDAKIIHLGRFDTREEAAIAYNQAAKQHHGEFAKLNDVPQHGELSALGNHL